MCEATGSLSEIDEELLIPRCISAHAYFYLSLISIADNAPLLAARAQRHAASKGRLRTERQPRFSPYSRGVTRPPLDIHFAPVITNHPVFAFLRSLAALFVSHSGCKVLFLSSHCASTGRCTVRAPGVTRSVRSRQRRNLKRASLRRWA